MSYTFRTLPSKKNIALVAHDNCKKDLLTWTVKNRNMLTKHTLYATGTTGHKLSHETGLLITSLISGPMGGDQQLGSLISQGEIDMLIFFWDPLNAVPHDPDVKALLRIASVWNIPIATNKASATFLINSVYMDKEISIQVPDYDAYITKRLSSK